MRFQNYQKIILLLSIIGLLFFSFSFLYNKEEKILAQEELIWQCGEEIPIGEAIDESLQMIANILNSADAMLRAGGEQIAAANSLYELPLPEECKAENCQTGCDITSKTVCEDVEVCSTACTDYVCETVKFFEDECPPDQVCELICDPVVGVCIYQWEEETCTECPEGKDCNLVCDPVVAACALCWQECEIVQECEEVFKCEIRPCTGTACPDDAIAELASLFGQISIKYGQIANNADAIKNEVGKRGAIIKKLEKARKELAECATPASGYTAEEEVQILQTLFSCEEAKFQRILTEEQEACYPTNFFCCRPIVP